mgnify:CR=1 FL=1
MTTPENILDMMEVSQLVLKYSECKRSHPHENWEHCLISALMAVRREMGGDLATQNKVVVFLRAEIEKLKAEKQAEAKRVTEAICGAMCVLCERHEPVQVDDVGDWVHPWLGGDPCDCDASVVRREMAKGREG